MLRVTVRRVFLCAMYPFNLIPNKDDKPLHEPQVKMHTLPELMPGEIAMYRLRKMFQMQDGELSKEIQSIIVTTFGATITGCMIGGFFASRDIPQNFIAENTATKFQNQFEAKRELQTKFTLAFGKGALKFGMKLGMFCFIFGASSTLMNVYRGKVEVLNYFGAGAVTGALYKMNMGLKGMISGGVVGTTIGGLYGACAVLMLYLAGVEMDNIYATQQSWVVARDKATRKQISDQMDAEMPRFKQLHELNQQAQLQNSQEAKVAKT